MNYKLITRNYEANDPITQILTNRGIAPEDVSQYLNISKKDILDPLLLNNMKDGAKLLIQAIADNKKAMIIVDADCDGITSAATLLNYLNRIVPHYVQSNITYTVHDGKKHGIFSDYVSDDIDLLIVPDAGSNDIAQCQELHNRGVDILILDHHEADPPVPKEYAIVINNQLCNYPTKSLSGVGIVYKFCCYLDNLLKTDYAQDYIDLVATGLCADVMDQRDQETHVLTQMGFNNIKNPFLKAYIEQESFSMKGKVNPTTIGWYIAPGINATTRSGTQAENLFLFEAMLEYRCYEQIPSTKRGCSGQMETRIEQAARNCRNIKTRQKDARDTLQEVIETKIQEGNLLDNKILIIKLNPEEVSNRNLLGLTANQLKSKYQRPALVVTSKVTEDGIEVSEGSGRNYDGCPTHDLRQFLLNSGLINWAQGHANSFGVSINNDNIDKLIDYVNEQFKDFNCEPCYYVDFIYDANNFKASDISDIAKLEPFWATNVDEALIAVEDISITSANIQYMSPNKAPTIKITLPNGVELLKFKSSPEELESLRSEHGRVIINAVGKCALNIWGGTVTPQILIEDYEIVSRQEFYF